MKSQEFFAAGAGIPENICQVFVLGKEEISTTCQFHSSLHELGNIELRRAFCCIKKQWPVTIRSSFCSAGQWT